jgi:hypothetical protein
MRLKGQGAKFKLALTMIIKRPVFKKVLKKILSITLVVIYDWVFKPILLIMKILAYLIKILKVTIKVEATGSTKSNQKKEFSKYSLHTPKPSPLTLPS